MAEMKALFVNPRAVDFTRNRREIAFRSALAGTRVTLGLNGKFARRCRQSLVCASMVACFGLAICGGALANEDFACPDGNFGRTRVFTSLGPEKMPDGCKALGNLQLREGNRFIVFGNKVLLVHDSALICINLQGEQAWQAKLAPSKEEKRYTIETKYEILGWKDKVIVASEDGSVTAFALSDGQQVWKAPGFGKKKTIVPIWAAGGAPSVSVPVIYKDCLIFAGARNVRRVNLADGTELKSFEFVDKGEERVLFTSPFATSDSTLFFSCMTEWSDTGNCCYAINLESGDRLWKQQTTLNTSRILTSDQHVIQIVEKVLTTTMGAPDLRPFTDRLKSYDFNLGLELPIEKSLVVTSILHQGASFVGHDNGLKKIDIRTNRTLWTYRSRTQVSRVLAIGGEILYAQDETGGIHAINASDGSSVWIYKTTSEYPGSAIPSNGALFYIGRSGPSYGMKVLGTPGTVKPAGDMEVRKLAELAAISKEIEDIEQQIGEFRKEWDECKRVLDKSPVAADVTAESKAQRESASQRVREIGEAVPKLKARKLELEKCLK